MISLSPSQQAVVDYFPGFLLSDDEKEMTISGFAGSGKSFLVRYLAQVSTKQQGLLRAVDPSFPEMKLRYTATTNKAAEVLQGFLGQEVVTIHSLLGLKVKNNMRTGRQSLEPQGQKTNLTNSIVFIDEASMINRELLSIIRKETSEYPNCKVVFIGDKYQLPPVKEDVCAVFNEGASTFFLTEIQRQAAGSPIIQLSQKFRDALDDHTQDWPEIQHVEGHIHVYGDDKVSYIDAIRQAYLSPHEPGEYKIVAWANARVIGYNNWIRKQEGRTCQFEPGEMVITNKPIFSERNRIVAQTDSMQRIRNVWASEEQGIKGFRLELEGLPDDFFHPADWAQARYYANQLAKGAKKTGNWAPYFYIKEQWTDLRPVHASTVHKAQGSTYREVFVDLENIGKCNNWRDVARLVYVALTRASERVHIYGQLAERYNKAAAIDLMEPFKNVDCI